MIKNKKGFTLLELLVAILIVGILAAVALPQYRLAVGKAKFSTIKNRARAIADAQQLYYVIYGVYATNPYDIEVDFTGITLTPYNFIFDDGSMCHFRSKGAECYILINRKRVYYTYNFLKGPGSCIAYSLDKADTANKVCQQETGKTAALASCGTEGGYCTYMY